MTALFDRLAMIGMVVVDALITVGFLIAIAKVAVGRHDGVRHLAYIGIATVLLMLWTTGELAHAVTTLLTAPSPGQPLSAPGMH